MNVLPLQPNMVCPSDNIPLITFYKRIRYRNLLWEWEFSHYFCPTCKTRYNEANPDSESNINTGSECNE